MLSEFFFKYASPKLKLKGSMLPRCNVFIRNSLLLIIKTLLRVQQLHDLIVI